MEKCECELCTLVDRYKKEGKSLKEIAPMLIAGNPDLMVYIHDKDQKNDNNFRVIENNLENFLKLFTILEKRITDIERGMESLRILFDHVCEVKTGAMIQ